MRSYTNSASGSRLIGAAFGLPFFMVGYRDLRYLGDRSVEVGATATPNRGARRRVAIHE